MTKTPTTVAVLVSFYGDSPYLKDFLDSLARQTFQDFKLLFRFDGAPQERNRALLAQYDFAEQVGDEAFLGIPETYWELMAHAAGYPYLMFADQDDVWHPDKIEKSLAAIREMGKKYGSEMSLLIHSDLTVINAKGKRITRSFFRYQSLNPRRKTLKDLMIQNNVTGCTMLFNRALAACLQAPAPAICHDWYMAMIAVAFGKISFIEDPLIDYRQHGKNYFGVCPVLRLLKHGFRRTQLHKKLALIQKQTQIFLENFRSRLAPEQIEFLEAWGKILPELPYGKRLTMVFRFHFRKNDRLRTLGMWWAL